MTKLIALLFIVSACTHKVYEKASPAELNSMKETIIPLKSGTKFKIGASPLRSGNDKISWSFNVPYGTPVVSVEDGLVTYVQTDGTRGGCGSENKGHGHVIHIQHTDGTVAHYLHLKVLVKQNEIVKKGQVIAMTAENGVLCTPNLHFMEYKDVKAMIKGPQGGKLIPLRFTGIPGGLAILDYEGTVP